MRIYLDTNVLMDFFLERDHSAYEVLIRSLRCEFSIVISHVVLEELLFQGLAPETRTFVSMFSGAEKLEIIPTTEEDRKRAKEELGTKKTHYNDALHKVIAMNANVDVLVTKNVKHFKDFKDIVVRRPDEI